MSSPLAVVLLVAGAIGTVGTAVGVLVVGARWVRARWRPVAEFLEDWRGEPARPGAGVEERPGVMKRLSALEATARTIKGEVTPNGGGSLKDLVRAIDDRTREDGERLTQHLTWHRNAGVVDPTARVLLTRPGDQS